MAAIPRRGQLAGCPEALVQALPATKRVATRRPIGVRGDQAADRLETGDEQDGAPER